MIETRKIIVLRGIQGSGKTTWAKQWVSEDPEHRVRFNRDDIRNMLGKYWMPSRENLITVMYYEFLNKAMLDGYDIVIDNMNLNPNCITEIETEVQDFNEWIPLFPTKLRYEIEIKDFFDVSLEECIERDSKREHPIGEPVIRNTYNKYKSVLCNGTDI